MGEEELVAFLEELVFVLAALRFGGDSVREVEFPPAGWGFDAIECGDRFADGEVGAFLGAEDFEFGECEDVVFAARGEFCCGDAHVASAYAVVFGGAGFEGCEAWVWEIVHEGGVVLSPDEENVFLKRGIVAHFDFESNGEAESGADFTEIVVARFKDDSLNINGFAEIYLYPLGRLVGGCDGTVVAVIGCRVGICARFLDAVDSFGESVVRGAAFLDERRFDLSDVGLD